MDDVTWRRARLAAWTLAALSSGVLTTGLVGLAAVGALPAAADESWVLATLAGSFPIAGALLVARRPTVGTGWLLLGIGLASAITIGVYFYGQQALVNSPGSLPGGQAAGWLSGWVWTLTAIPAATLLPLLFPDGRLPSPRWRPVLWLVGVAIAAPATAGMFAPGPLANFPQTRNPVGLSWFGPVVGPLGGFGFAAFLAATALSIASVVIRWHRADGELRAQLRCMVFAVLALGGALAWAIPAPSPAANAVACLATAMLPVAIAVAVLRYRLYEVDLVVNRSLVYGLATLLLVVAYAAVVVGVTEFVGRPGASVLATAAVAMAFAPLRGALQGAVDRGLYGLRDDPNAALRRLAHRIDATIDPEQVLPAVVDTVRSALRVPYAAVRLVGVGSGAPAIERGVVDRETTEVPLMHRGQPVGVLILGKRPGGELSSADETLLADLAVSAAAAVHSVLLHADLLRSRERIVVAREEERRRLRRDLHDGLGPTLTGVVLGVQAARNTIRDGGMADALLAGAEEQAQQAIADVRRVVNDLRPPSLDELGLEAVLRSEAARLSAVGTLVDVRVDNPGALRELPAAVEVAAFRIAMEALTNVARHAHASRAHLDIRANGALDLVVRDDGVGFSASQSRGVGMTSMVERARELGGDCEIDSAPSHGTTVRAHLPVDYPRT